MENPIRELRKQGLLAEAHELGRARLAEEPDNLWIKRDLAWVCYDQAKAETESADPARLLGCLEELAELGLSHEETMLAESIDWLLGKRIGRVVLPLKNLSERWEQLRVLVVARTRLPLAAPSKGHSFYRQSVHRAAKDTPFYCAVMDAVGFDDGWMPEDYRTSTTPKGQKVMSLVEQIYIAYAKALLRLIMKHYTRERRVSFYAEQLHLSPQHLCTTVKQQTGKTVADMIADVVIMDARALLKSTNMAIKEIAITLNFPNVSFFGKYFKRHVGMSPQQYRNS